MNKGLYFNSDPRRELSEEQKLKIQEVFDKFDFAPCPTCNAPGSHCACIPNITNIPVDMGHIQITESECSGCKELKAEIKELEEMNTLLGDENSNLSFDIGEMLTERDKNV